MVFINHLTLTLVALASLSSAKVACSVYYRQQNARSITAGTDARVGRRFIRPTDSVL